MMHIRNIIRRNTRPPSSHYWSKWREKQKERSDRARHAVNIRWERYHAEKAIEPVAIAIPDPCYRLTIENYVTGKSHLLEFHPTERINQFRISVDGHDWSTGGWSKALAKVRKSCVRMRRYA